MAKLRRR